MRLNHSDVVLDFEGAPLTEPGPDGPREVTFRAVALTALNGTGDREQMGAEDKARCFNISTKFFRGKHVKLTVGEASFLQDRGGVMLTPMAYGRLIEWIEGKPQAVATDVEDDDLDEADQSTGDAQPLDAR